MIARALIAVALVSACAANKFDPPATPAVIAAMPDTIPCDKAVQIKAATEGRGIRAERDWLDAYYPGHTHYGQAVIHENGRSYDRLTFRRSDGREASVCFDITSFFGKW